MKKILALILALMLALSSAGALAEAIRIDPAPAAAENKSGEIVDIPVGEGISTITANLTLDEETVMGLIQMAGSVNEKILPVLGKAVSLLNNLTFRVSVLENAGQLDLLLKDEAIVSIAGKGSEEGIIIGSDLIPNYLIAASGEEIQQIVSMLKEQFQAQAGLADWNIDPNELLNAVMPHVMMAVMEFQGKIGEPEPGEYTFEDALFNLKTPINMTTKEAVLLVLNTVKAILNEEVIASFIEEIESKVGKPINLNLEALDEAIANMEESDEEDQPVLEAAIYSLVDEDGNASNRYVVLSLLKDEEGITLNGGLIDGTLYLHVNVIEQLSLNLVGKVEEGVLTADLDVAFQGMYVRMNIVRDGSNFNLKLYFMNPESPLLTLDVAVAPGAELTLPLDTEGKNVVTITELMNDEEGTVKQGLLMDVYAYGLNGVLSKAATAMPEEVMALMGLLNGGAEQAPEAPETVTE